MDSQNNISDELTIPSYVINFERNNAKSLEENQDYYQQDNFQQFLKNKAILIWQKRNEQNTLIIILSILFLLSFLIHWVFGTEFCIFAALLAIYEITPKLQKFKNDKKKLKKYIIAIYLGCAQIGIILMIIFWKSQFIQNVLSITSGQAIGLTISFLIIKKMKRIAKQKRLLNEVEQNKDQDLGIQNYVNEELGFEISFDNLEEKLKNYCIIGFLSSIILLWIIGIITNLYVLQFIFYTILTMILYEGTGRVPIISSRFTNKNQLLLILFLGIGILLLIFGIFSGLVYKVLSADCFGCCISIYFFKKWKKIMNEEFPNISEQKQQKSEAIELPGINQGNHYNLNEEKEPEPAQDESYQQN